MRMIWQGIGETFRSLALQQDKITRDNMTRTLTVMLAMLKAATPKDTGFATSRWKISGLFPEYRVENDASYIEYLNQGSSKQAPSFFIESIALRFGRPYGAIVTVVPSSPGS